MFQNVEYYDYEGKKKKSNLLTSGYWGLARHLNYFLEINIALSTALPARGYGVLPYGYFIFITILVIHRVMRDEEKLRKKYGKGFDEYCKKVPYRLIPYIF